MNIEAETRECFDSLIGSLIIIIEQNKDYDYQKNLRTLNAIKILMAKIDFRVIVAVYRKNLFKPEIESRIRKREDKFFLSPESNAIFGSIPYEYIKFFRVLWSGESGEGALTIEEKNDIWDIVHGIYDNVRQWIDKRESIMSSEKLDKELSDALESVDKWINLLKNLIN